MKNVKRVLAITALPLLFACTSDAPDADISSPQFAKPPVVSDPTSSWLLPLDATGLAFASDGEFAAGSYSVYENGVCGVSSKIFATTAASNSGDATMQTDNARASDRRCADYPRKVSFTYPDNGTETVTFHGNLSNLQNTTYAIPVGATVTRALNLNSSTSASRCGTLKFRAVDNTGTVLGADSVLVTRIDAQTWDVATQAAPNNRAYCTNTGELYGMPLQFRIVAATPQP